MPPVPAAVPTTLTQPRAGHREGRPVPVFAQDDTRLGLQPSIRRRMTADGVHPGAPGWQRFDHVALVGAVDPTTGGGCVLGLPLLNSALCQRWWDDVAQPFAASWTSLVRDNGAFHPAKARRWPPTVATGPGPPSRPALHPMGRLGRALQAQWAHSVAKPLDALADTGCGVMQRDPQAARQAMTGVASFVPAAQTALHFPNV